MSEKMQQLKEILGEVADLNHAASLLGWDQQTYMPPMGAEARGQQLATLGKISHEKFTDEKVGHLIGNLREEFADAGPDSDEAAMLRVASRNYDKATKVTAEFVAEQTIVTTKAFEAWQEARRKSDFSIFRPHLEKVVELTRKYVSFFPPADHPYDILLDDYEPGMKTAEVKEIFGDLRPKQVELLKRIKEAKQVKDSFLHKKYDEKKLWDFSEEVSKRYGYDFNRGRQDKVPHPFETSFSANDVRITTRFEPQNPMAMLFSTLHETGHALYEQGVSLAYERTPLAHGGSLAMHESQSRMWENLVGRSKSFWKYFFPRLKKVFPSNLGNVDLKNFYKAINKVEPSYIRVNADEATYNLHIMLRLEIEIAMVEGTVSVKDLPDLWNTKMKDYLGVTPPNDAMGVLQDVHWSYGSIGYFSTYALGNLISAQLWEKISADIPDIDEQISKGKFDALLNWLRTKIHIYGKKYEPQDLVKRVTGSQIDAIPYVNYLTNKYTDIYGL